MTLIEIKEEAIDKFCQGDVNIYFLKKEPHLKTVPHVDSVLVTGQSGNNHCLTGTGFKVGKTDGGEFVVEVTGNKVAFAHEQHKPPIQLKPGWYLFDRAIEVGMFNDMKAPVVD